MLDQAQGVGGKGARSAADEGLLRDHVIGVAGMDLGDAEDRRVERSDISRHDGLQRRRDVAGDDHRIDPGFRAGAVRAAAGDGDVEIGAACHHRAGADLKSADRQPRPVVHAKNRIARKALEEPILHHRLAAAEPFFGRLKDQMDSAVEFAALGQVAGGAEQHRGVPVVAAGVHASLMARTIGEIRGFLDRQRIHVSPQTDRAR